MGRDIQEAASTDRMEGLCFTAFAFFETSSFYFFFYLFDCLCRLFCIYLFLPYTVAHYHYRLTLTSKDQILHDLCVYQTCIIIPHFLPQMSSTA